MLLENRRAKQTQSVINVPHFRLPGFFVVNNNLAVAEDDVARVVLSFVAIHRHQTAFTTSLKKLRNRRERSREIGIAVENEKLFSQFRQRLSQRAASAKKFWPVERINQLDSVCAAIAEFLLDHFAEVAQAQHDFTKA